KECIKFLIEEKIIQKPEKCYSCNGEIYLYLKENVFKYRNSDCKKMITVFKNTFFSQHRLKCSNILLISYFWIHKLRIQQIYKITNIARITIRNFIKDFRNLAIKSLTPDNEIVGGPRIIVEIESLFNDFWVIGDVQKSREKKFSLS
ncbi:17407_t:CDS:1, partial [Dentiscutata erythropus]